MTERRAHRLRRIWWTVTNPGRFDRFNRWRRSPKEVTRGFLFFRDLILLAFVTAIVLAGISVVRDLRAEDCRGANARRAEIEDATQKLLDNDRNLIEFADLLSADGLPDAFKRPLLERYLRQQIEIRDAYRPANCPGPDFPDV